LPRVSPAWPARGRPRLPAGGRFRRARTPLAHGVRRGGRDALSELARSGPGGRVYMASPLACAIVCRAQTVVAGRTLDQREPGTGVRPGVPATRVAYQGRPPASGRYDIHPGTDFGRRAARVRAAARLGRDGPRLQGGAHAGRSRDRRAVAPATVRAGRRIRVVLISTLPELPGRTFEVLGF